MITSYFQGFGMLWFFFYFYAWSHNQKLFIIIKQFCEIYHIPWIIMSRKYNSWHKSLQNLQYEVFTVHLSEQWIFGAIESRNVSLSLWRTCKKSSSVSLGSMSMMSMTLQGSHDSLTDLISPPVYMSVVATIALLCTAHWVYRVILSWLVRFRNSWVYTHQGPGTLWCENIFSDTFNLNFSSR